MVLHYGPILYNLWHFQMPLISKYISWAIYDVRVTVDCVSIFNSCQGELGEDGLPGKEGNPVSWRFYSLSPIIIHQIFSLSRDWLKSVTWLNIPRKVCGISAKYRVCYENYLKDNKHFSLCFALQCVRVIVWMLHYLFEISLKIARAFLWVQLQRMFKYS